MRGQGGDNLKYDNMVCNENVIEFMRNQKTMTVTFSQKRFVNKVRKMAEKYPDEIQIIEENEDGSIMAHMPLSALHIGIVKHPINDEQRGRLINGLRRYWDSKRK